MEFSTKKRRMKIEAMNYQAQSSSGRRFSQEENYLGSNNMSACVLNICQKLKRVKLKKRIVVVV
jgi:hypothetical protein